MKYQKIVIGVVVFAVLAFAVYAYVLPIFAQSNVEVTQDSANSQLVTCNVQVKNPAGLPFGIKNGDLVIENIDCNKIYVRTCAGAFGVWSDKGDLTVKGDGGQGTSSKLNIDEGSSSVSQLKWCGSKVTRKVSIILSDENNNQLSVKDYTIN